MSKKWNCCEEPNWIDYRVPDTIYLHGHMCVNCKKCRNVKGEICTIEHLNDKTQFSHKEQIERLKKEGKIDEKGKIIEESSVDDKLEEILSIVKNNEKNIKILEKKFEEFIKVEFGENVPYEDNPNKEESCEDVPYVQFMNRDNLADLEEHMNSKGRYLKNGKWYETDLPEDKEDLINGHRFEYDNAEHAKFCVFCREKYSANIGPCTLKTENW